MNRIICNNFCNLLKYRRLIIRCQYTFKRCKSSIRIGCASGFWGDTQVSVPQLVHNGNLDFLVFDYLSEITMSLVAGVKKKNPDLGYIPDFLTTAMVPYIQDIKEKGIRVISNAGALNPKACAAILKNECAKKGVDLKIAVVTGDDLMPMKSKMNSVREMETNEPLPDAVNTMNAYLGANPIAEALNHGADVVITGRCVDSALALGPLIHTFKWRLDDWNKMAAGSLAGHVIECGPQSTGGIFTDWDTVSDWYNIGFPIVECEKSGDFVVTKPNNTSGVVSFGTVAEQILYEVHDPNNYALPDVICDFSNINLQEINGNVKVSGVKGKPSSSYYKVSATYADGFRSTAVCPIVGPRAREKAIKTAESILKRCRQIFKKVKLDDFSRTRIEVLGSGSNYGSLATVAETNTREAVLWLAVTHKNESALKIFSREIAPAATGMAPGFTTLIGGRPKVSPILKLFSFLYPKKNIQAEIWLNDKLLTKLTEIETTNSTSSSSTQTEKINENPILGTNSYPLKQLAFTRSGDKGNTANIGVIARHPAFLPYIRSSLTTEIVAKYFQHLYDPTSNPTNFIERYDAPGLNAINFVLKDCLGGGGIASLHSDPQGKALAQILLDFNVTQMPSIETLINKK